MSYKFHNVRVKYQESSIGFENLAYLQSIEGKCKQDIISWCKSINHLSSHSYNPYVSTLNACIQFQIHRSRFSSRFGSRFSSVTIY